MPTLPRFNNLLSILAFTLISWLQALPATAKALHVQSPDKQLNLYLEISPEGSPLYWLNHQATPLLLPSTLGLSLKQGPNFSSGFIIKSHSVEQVNQPWQRLWGESKQVENQYNALSIQLVKRNKPEQILRLEFRLFNDGLGFRYTLPEQPGLKRIEITAENTQFKFTGKETAWWIPQDFDSYEHLYRKNLLSDLSAVNTPITLQHPSGVYLSIHEAALSDYAGMTLVKQDQGTLVSELVPWPDGIKVKANAPLTTPWRTIQFAKNAAELINSPLIENLNPPNKLADTSWIKPMKYIGIWWGMHMRKYTWEAGPKHGATTQNTRTYIDFAKQHGMGGVLVEGWNKGWETWHTELNQQNFTEAYGDFDLFKLANYAKKNGLSLIGHHETGGNIPAYEKQLEQAFALYRKAGVSALKTGYAGKMLPEGTYHHGQFMVRHYRKVLQLAAENQIMLNAHEPIKATGVRRTYPNMMTREGGRGMEWNGWSKGNPPEHTVTLPFTRLLAGPMDYTPGIFDIRFDPQKQYRIHTTLARQLAHYLTLYSPMQMAADMIENYREHPAFKFIEQVPTTWDDTQVQHAAIGDYYVVARRQGDTWFIGATTDENPRQLPLDLNFLNENTRYLAEIYSDSDNSDFRKQPEAFEQVNVLVNKNSRLPLVMASGGGTAIKISPISSKPSQAISASTYRKRLAKRLARFEKGSRYGEIQRVKHLALNKNIQLSPSPHKNYADNGAASLVDGIRGGPDYTSLWLGFLNTPFSAMVDLGQVQDIQEISVGFMQSLLHSIMLPTEVKFEISTDNRHFIPMGIKTYTTKQGIPDFQFKQFQTRFAKQPARFIKVSAQSPGKLPNWHIRPGQEVFIFADEITVK